MTILDARLHRPLEGGASFPLSHRLYRLVWQIAWLLGAAWTPPVFRPWRRWLLNRFGADLARGADVRASARIWYPPNLRMAAGAVIGPRATCYNMAPVTLGRHAYVSQGAHLCTGSHDPSDPHFQLTARPIGLGERAWVAAEAFVGPGVTVGAGAILGARGVTFSDLPAWTVHCGNPARFLRPRRLTLPEDVPPPTRRRPAIDDRSNETGRDPSAFRGEAGARARTSGRF